MQTKANLPFDSIAIGKIENKTLEPKLQDRFSRSLAETFAEYGFSVTPSARYKLEGEITRFELTPLAEVNLVASQYQVVIRAKFRLIDTKTGKMFPLVAENPFITAFGSSGKLEDVLAQKELSTEGALKSISQEAVRTISYSTPKDFENLLLSSADIKNLDSLIFKLKDARDPLSEYLFDNMTIGARKSIMDYDMSDFESRRLRGLLVNELNRIIQGPSIYAEERFGRIILSEETKNLIRQKPTGMARIRLNRLLLEEAYPSEISRFKTVQPEQK
jgi:hypothetical protein